MNLEKDKLIYAKEQLEILICHYPFWESLNPKLHTLIKAFPDEYQRSTNVKAKMTHYCVVNQEFEKIGRWVYQKLPSICPHGLNTTSKFKLVDIWGALYDENDYTVAHMHRPLSYSFVYFVNTPKNSAPLIFNSSNIKIKPEPGKCIIFPSWLIHSVPKNKSKERSVVAENFAWMPEDNPYRFD